MERAVRAAASRGARQCGRRRRAARLAILGALVAAGACGGGRVDGGDGALPAPRGAITVAAENNHWNDVTVYAVRDGTRFRLGTVTAMNRGSFTVPAAAAAAGEVRLLLDPIGGSAYLTEPVLVRPGQVIELSIENHLPLSSWSVR
ncbi:MAG TPA: hypothetical protein VF212_17045 [Longimicrobiales bacterium]